MGGESFRGYRGIYGLGSDFYFEKFLEFIEMYRISKYILKSKIWEVIGRKIFLN